MHPIQASLLELSKEQNLAKLTLRGMAKEIGMPNESPQKIKHHLLQLQKKGFLSLNRASGVMDRSALVPGWATGLLEKTSQLFSIPIIGTASAGPASIYAEQNFQGVLRVSSKLVGVAQPTGLFAIKVNGSSMNLAAVNGKKIEDGDFVIVDSNAKDAQTGDVVLAVIDNKATIKRFVNDHENGQIVLKADSSLDYEPIYIHADDDFSINGKIVGVVKNPHTK